MESINPKVGSTKCLICKSDAQAYFSTNVLSKYDVQYYKCSHCQFIFTEHPYWLSEAYDSAITRLDIGLVQRNQLMAPVVKAVINKWFNPNAKFVDYGGGYGMLVRMMRDEGIDFYRQDIYCENLYAQSFDVMDIPPFQAELLTAFEVFEHLVNPIEELEKMLKFSDSILFSTTVQPNNNVTPESWWYFTPETGQHVSLYSHKTLRVLADRFGLNYYWSEKNVHLLTRKSISQPIFKLIANSRVAKWYNKIYSKNGSLLKKDFVQIQSELKELSMGKDK